MLSYFNYICSFITFETWNGHTGNNINKVNLINLINFDDSVATETNGTHSALYKEGSAGHLSKKQKKIAHIGADHKKTSVWFFSNSIEHKTTIFPKNVAVAEEIHENIPFRRTLIL